MPFTTVTQAECHETCLDIQGPDNHIANVNPIGGTDKWRVDCDGCGTCIRAGLDTKREATIVARIHVLISPEDYWALHSQEKLGL